MKKSLATLRSKAFVAQNGCCHYCKCRMWLSDPAAFMREHNLTAKQARRFQCTAEHVIARQDGGMDTEGNIVAACRHCNSQRHQHPKKAPTSERYAKQIEAKLRSGRWAPVPAKCRTTILGAAPQA